MDDSCAAVPTVPPREGDRGGKLLAGACQTHSRRGLVDRLERPQRRGEAWAKGLHGTGQMAGPIDGVPIRTALRLKADADGHHCRGDQHRCDPPRTAAPVLGIPSAPLGIIRSGMLVEAASTSEAEPQRELDLSRCVPLAPNHSERTRTEPCIRCIEVWRVGQVKELRAKLKVGSLRNWKVLEDRRIKLTDSRRASVR